MMSKVDFSAVLDAAEQLDPEAQAELVSVLSRRLAERGREQLAVTVAAARQEFATGKCVQTTVDDLLNEVHS